MRNKIRKQFVWGTTKNHYTHYSPLHPLNLDAKSAVVGVVGTVLKALRTRLIGTELASRIYRLQYMYSV